MCKIMTALFKVDCFTFLDTQVITCQKCCGTFLTKAVVLVVTKDFAEWWLAIFFSNTNWSAKEPIAGQAAMDSKWISNLDNIWWPIHQEHFQRKSWLCTPNGLTPHSNDPSGALQHQCSQHFDPTMEWSASFKKTETATFSFDKSNLLIFFLNVNFSHPIDNLWQHMYMHIITYLDNYIMSKSMFMVMASRTFLQNIQHIQKLRTVVARK